MHRPTERSLMEPCGSMHAWKAQSPPRLAAAVRALTLTLLHMLDTLEPSAKVAPSAALELRRW